MIYGIERRPDLTIVEICRFRNLGPANAWAGGNSYDPERGYFTVRGRSLYRMPKRWRPSFDTPYSKTLGGLADQIMLAAEGEKSCGDGDVPGRKPWPVSDTARRDRDTVSVEIRNYIGGIDAVPCVLEIDDS